MYVDNAMCMFVVSAVPTATNESSALTASSASGKFNPVLRNTKEYDAR